MNYRPPIRALGCVVLCVATTFACAQREGPDTSRADLHPLVLISLDTTRRDHLSVYGYDRETTPNLAALARDAVVVQDFYTTSSWTLPSHASLFTGLFPATHGAHYSNLGQVALGDAEGAPRGFESFRANRLPQQATTLAEVLRDHGYATAAVAAGPWFKPVFGLDQGFDHYDADFHSLSGRRGDEVTRLALPLIEGFESRAFFLFLNYFDPHDPYDGHETSWERFLRPDADFAHSKQIARYDAEIFFMDEQIGRVVETLKARGLYARSWIVVVSDHGEHFGEHGLEKHGFSLFEPVVRGVLLIKPPEGVELEVGKDARPQSVDVMPTLLDAMGIAAPSPMEGEPLRALSHPVVSELYRSLGNVRWKGERFRRELRALYDGDYKLVVSSKDADPDAGLFDLRSDPGETRDLSGAKPEVARALRERLAGWASRRHPLQTIAVEDLDAETRRQMEALGYIDHHEEEGP